MNRTKTAALLIIMFIATGISPESKRPATVDSKAHYISRAKLWILDSGNHQTVWFSNGNMKATGDFKRSQREGEWKFWFENGNPKGEGRYKNNLKVGFWKLYHENGTLQSEGEYRQNKKQGPWKTYYDSGALESTGSYDMGQKNGPWKNFYGSGQLFYTGIYSNGMAHGEFTYYFKNGNLYQQGSYERDVRVGKWRLCIFAMGPCDNEYYTHPSVPRTAGLPPMSQSNSPKYDTKNPSALLESLDTGPVPDNLPPSITNPAWGQ